MGETATDPRVFSEDEAYAIAADRVSRETAELNGKIEELQRQVAALTAERDEAANKLDVEITAREAAEKKHEDFLAELEAEKAKQSKKEDRLAKVREAANHLDDDFFADEARVDRIVAMDDEVFEGYVSDLKVAAAKAGPSGEGTPRETAMEGQTPAPKAGAAPAAENFLTRNYFTPKEG